MKGKDYPPDERVVVGHSVQVEQQLLEEVHCGVGRMLGSHVGLEGLHHEGGDHEVGVLHEEGVLEGKVTSNKCQDDTLFLLNNSFLCVNKAD